MEDDFYEELLNRHDYEGPVSLWEGMFEDEQLSLSVIGEVVGHCVKMVTTRLSAFHSLYEVLVAHTERRIPFRVMKVDSPNIYDEGLSLPSFQIIEEAGQLAPVLNINFEDFSNLLFDTPELIASVIQYLYLNYQIQSGKASVFFQSNGNVDFDNETMWGMNNAVATTLICLGVEDSRYSRKANNMLSPFQRTFYSTLLEETRASWKIPSHGGFSLN
jgi:hypothetical protein